MYDELTSRCWSRLRVAVGPVAAGLLGGLLTGFLAVPNFEALCRNMAATYDQFPGLQRPWLATGYELPLLVRVLMIAVGVVGPMAIGAAAVWLARTRDAWADLSAGLSAAVAATLSAFAAGIGWPTMLALVVVPSITDLTALGEARPPEALAQRYADLRPVEPARRGERLMAKVVADQAAGSAHGVWVGLLLAGLTAGAHALAGAFAAGYLRRRGESLRSGAVPYLEITLPLMTTVAVLVATVLHPAWQVLIGHNPFAVAGPTLIGLAVMSTLMIAGVVRRWPGWLRLCLGLTWFLLIAQSQQPQIPWPLPLAAAALTGTLVARNRLVRPRPVPAQA